MIFPRDVVSAVSDLEASWLQVLATDKVVLELGAHYGFSTIVMAQVAREVHSVDWHLGDSMAGHGDNLLVYRDNLRRHGVDRKVISHVGRFEDVLPALQHSYFDGCFLDGEHDRESVSRDLNLLWPLVLPFGWVALHDYGRFEVAPVVDSFADQEGLNVEVYDTLAVVRKRS